MLAWLKTEPVYLMALIQAALGLVTAFGMHLTGEQIGAILTISAAILAAVVRQTVTPNSISAANVQVALNTPVPAVKP